MILAVSRFHLRRHHQASKPAERIVQGLFVDHRVKVPHEELRTDLDRLLLVCRGLSTLVSIEVWKAGMDDSTLLTLIGLPYSRTWFMIRAAYSASSSLMNSTNPYP